MWTAGADGACSTTEIVLRISVKTHTECKAEGVMSVHMMPAVEAVQY